MTLAIQVIVFIAFLLWFIFLIKRFNFFQLEGVKPIVLQLAFLVKVIAGTGLWALYTYYYTDRANADIYKYFDDGYYLFNQLKGEPLLALQWFFGAENKEITEILKGTMNWSREYNFGVLNDNRTKWLLKGVVKGIGSYGNAFGIPVVGGEVFFDDCYNTNPLVNAMSAGIMKADKMISATSYGVGNPVYIVGSATGKDGIHGAAFASKDITEESANDLPAVQVGDPFQEKLLLEASLELAETDAIIGMQDMGAAGITCSTSEMSGKEGFGMTIDLDKVPTRQEGMKPFEILLSESQERMLVVVKKGREAEVEAIFDKWDLNCEQIGEVTEGGQLEYYMGGKLVAHVPAESLVLGGGAPVYEREYKEPAYFAESQKFKIDSIEEPKDLKGVAYFLINHPNIASKKWVIEQYDSMVGTINMSTNKPTDAGIVNIKGLNKALAFTVDCNARYVNANPEEGCAIAVAEAARNIVCSGGEPSAITNCLNFGNPYNPEVYWQFVGAIKGMKKSCEKFKTPVTGGNVSFYNQSMQNGKDVPVFPTPTIGMMGIVTDKKFITSLAFQNEGDLIYLIGGAQNDINSSEYLYSYHKVKQSPSPYFNLDEEHALQNQVKRLIQAGMLNSAHDVADGGLFITLLEAGMPNGLGFLVETDSDFRKDAYLFGEAQSRVVASINPDNQDEFVEHMVASGLEYTFLGTAEGKEMIIDGVSFGTVADAKHQFETALENRLNS